MLEPINCTINVEDWRRALIAIKRDVLDAEPISALERTDRLLDALEGEGEPIRTLNSVYSPYG